MSSVSINWEEPPANSRNNWDEIAATLVANPGRWAKVNENTSSGSANNLRRRGKFEFKFISAGRGYKAGRVDIYARFVGDSND